MSNRQHDPEVGLSMPVNILIRVVFPEFSGARNPKRVFSSTSIVILLKTVAVLKLLVNDSHVIAAIPPERLRGI
jgi:hypothetical protein